MFRKRIAAFTLAACLVSVSGCSELSGWMHSFFHRPVVCGPECATGASPCCSGTGVDEAGPYLGAPPEAGLPPAGSYVAPAAPIGPAGPQRIVPQPAAQPDAYTPTNARPRLLSAFQK